MAKFKRDTRCIDCGYQTQSRNPQGDYEQYIVLDEIWAAAGMPPAERVSIGKHRTKELVVYPLWIR